MTEQQILGIKNVTQILVVEETIGRILKREAASITTKLKEIAPGEKRYDSGSITVNIYMVEDNSGRWPRYEISAGPIILGIAHSQEPLQHGSLDSICETSLIVVSGNKEAASPQILGVLTGLGYDVSETVRTDWKKP